MCDGVEPGGLCTGKELPTFQPHPGHSAGAACGGSENQSVASSARRKDLGAAGGKTDRRERPREGFPGGRHNRPQGHLPPDVSRGTLLRTVQQDSFYPFIEVVFEIKDGKHYHVPITLSPYGYSTYRGN